MRLIEDEGQAGATLAELFAAARNAVVFTGAGISTESGIPDFRSPGGVWSRMEPIPFQDFVDSEERRLEDWRRRFDMLDRFRAAEPNAAHRAIARLMETGPVEAVVTQNVDGLHARAGCPDERVIELHGNGTRAACLSCGKPAELEPLRVRIERTGRAPLCPACGGLLKAAIVSFGQSMPEAEMARAEAATLAADLFVALGSSLVVYPAAGFPLLAKRNGARLVIVNREETDQDAVADVVMRVPIGAAFAALDG